MLSSLNEPAFYLHFESAKLRAILRVYLTILFLIFATLARQYCITRGKLRILTTGGPIKVAFFTGWLPATTAIEYWFRMRSPPAGWFGIVMVLIPLLALLSDISVAGLVTTTALPGRCSFATGVVIPAKPVDWRSVPGNQQRASWMIRDAHDTSRRNGGQTGIYWKANRDTTFRADSKDVIGGWKCSHNVNGTVDYVKDTNSVTIANDLASRNLIYNRNASCSNSYPDRARSDLLYLSPSVDDGVQLPWDIRVSLDVTQKGPHQPIRMQSFWCTMEAAQVEWILSRIESLATLKQWCLGIYGSIENRTVETTLQVLTDTFNTMIMVGWGGGINAYDTPTGGSEDPDSWSQGCLVQRSRVPWPVYSLVVIDTVAVIMIGFAWIIIRVNLALHSRGNTAVRTSAPGELLDWIKLSIEEEEYKVSPSQRHWFARSKDIDYNRWTLELRRENPEFRKLCLKKLE